MSDEQVRYNETAVHFEVDELPSLLAEHLPPGPLALADFGCGDGPLFGVLARRGHIGPERLVCAVDLEERRLARVAARLPFVTTCVSPADSVPDIGDASLDWVLSTMVMEHVPDEARYLGEIRRVLRPGGRAYISTVFKKPWAWYFRKRDGETVLDTSHLREYTDLAAFTSSLMENQRFRRLVAIELSPMWFPLLDPLLFRLAGRGWLRSPVLLRRLRSMKVPIPGYYTLEVIVER
ncbi:MAG: class I SAM-dependent methyltransferase [Acidimicrobiales bacterium]